MEEMCDFAQIVEQEQDQESESSFRTRSLLDRFRIPNFEPCMMSKHLTCGCSLTFIGLAIFFFVSTNYILDSPVTEARQIIFAFIGVGWLLLAAFFLSLRFGFFNVCGVDNSSDTLFEIVRKEDTDPRNSFEMEQPPFEITSEEGSSQAEAQNNAAHSVDEVYRAHVSEFRNNAGTQRPKHSITKIISPDIPLLPLRRSVEISEGSRMQLEISDERLQNLAIVSGSSSYPSNYSTFLNRHGAAVASNLPPIENIVATEPTSLNSPSAIGSDVSDSGARFGVLTFKSGSDVSETEPISSSSSFKGDCDTSEDKQLLSE